MVINNIFLLQIRVCFWFPQQWSLLLKPYNFFGDSVLAVIKKYTTGQIIKHDVTEMKDNKNYFVNSGRSWSILVEGIAEEQSYIMKTVFAFDEIKILSSILVVNEEI